MVYNSVCLCRTKALYEPVPYTKMEPTMMEYSNTTSLMPENLSDYETLTLTDTKEADSDDNWE